MNFCNFAKVIIGRNSKEPLSVNSSSQDGKSEIANKTSNVSSIFRYNFYSNIMYNYSKMHMPYKKFIRQLPRLQNYLTKPKYWKNKNKFEEKKIISKNFHFNNGSCPQKSKNSPIPQRIVSPVKIHWSTIRPCTVQHQKKWKILLKFQNISQI